MTEIDGAAAAGAPAYEAGVVAKRLLRCIRAGALGTLERAGGGPFVTLVNVATDFDGSPILLMSGLSEHTKNLAADPRASILLAEGGKGDPLAHPRLTLVGRLGAVEEAVARAGLRRRFLARHPKSSLYADFGDFAFWRLALTSGHLNGGFGKAAELGPAALLTDMRGADELVAVEEGALAHLNDDHAQALRLYATAFAGEPDGPWRATGLDPEGLDLAWADRTCRIELPQRVLTGTDLRVVLARLAAKARAEA